jgi:hypothetical protein
LLLQQLRTARGEVMNTRRQKKEVKKLGVKEKI